MLRAKTKTTGGLRRRRGWLSVALAAAAIGAWLPETGYAQPAPYLAGAKGWENNPAGISGVWYQDTQRLPSTLPPRQRIARTVEGQIPPMLPWAKDLLEKRVADAEQGKYFANTASLCLPQGIPYMFFGAVDGPIQILETPGQVTILSEELSEHWLIYLTRQHPPGTPEPSYHGDSVGHWEGDTLVVDTVGLHERTTLDQVGMPHSDALHVVTRIRRLDPKTLEFTFTIDDPKTFERPWDRKVRYRLAEPGDQIYEDICDNQRISESPDGHQIYKVN